MGVNSTATHYKGYEIHLRETAPLRGQREPLVAWTAYSPSGYRYQGGPFRADKRQVLAAAMVAVDCIRAEPTITFS